MNKKLLSVLLAASMVLAACSPAAPTGSSASSNAGENAATTEKDKDQTYKSFLNAEPTTLDSAKAADNYAISVIMATQEPLVYITDGEGGKIMYSGGGAEKWDISEDGKTYTFHLRDNKWSDGQPVKASDYEYGIKRAIDPATGSPYSYLLNPILKATEANSGKATLDEVGVKALDDKTLEIKLTEPTPHFIGVMANTVTFAVRKDAVEKNGEKYGTKADTVIYNGSHVVKEWVNNSKITLEKNPNFWNEKNVNFTTVQMPIITDTNTLMSSMETNDVDSVSTNIGEWQQRFKANDKIEHRVIENPATYFMMFNTKDKVMSNMKIRRAMSAAIDRKDINDVIWNGNNIPARGWLPGNIFVGEEQYKDKTEDVVAKLQQEVGDPKALLVEGLKELGMDPDPTKLTLTITLGNTDQWFKTYGEYLQQVFKNKLGITLNVEQMEWTVFADKIQKGDFQIGYMAWGSELAEPIALLSIFLSDSDQVGSGWANKEYDELVLKAQVETDPAKRLEMYQKAEAILMNEAPVAPVVHSVSNNFTYKYVKGVDYNPFGNTAFRIGFISGR